MPRPDEFKRMLDGSLRSRFRELFSTSLINIQDIPVSMSFRLSAFTINLGFQIDMDRGSIRVLFIKYEGQPTDIGVVNELLASISDVINGNRNMFTQYLM